MTWVVEKIKWIMLVSGALTCSVVYAVIAPQAALRLSFGASLEGPVAEIIVRNWAALIALIGALLIYGAYNPATRSPILIIAALGKLTFIALVLMHGKQFLAHQAGIAVVFDSVMVLLFMGYLTGVRRARNAA